MNLMSTVAEDAQVDYYAFHLFETFSCLGVVGADNVKKFLVSHPAPLQH
jgi:hypothetical protein